MIDAVKAIEKIKIHLKTQIDNGTLNGTYQESTTSISFYVYKTPNTTEPLLTLRVTDHRPDLQKYIRSNAPRPSIEPNTNMSVEFYIPKMDVRGNIKQNKYRNKVLSPSNISVVQPFSVSSYNYDSRKLDIGDDDIILNAVMDWVQNSHGKYPYKDPFENTPKAAKELTKTAKVSIIGKNAVDTNISNGNYGADYVSESRNNNKTDKNESKIMSKKNTINEARRPANKQVGQHLFKGLRYDSNGNPLYTCDTLSNEEAQAMGWKFSPKYGLYGQLSNPTMFYESKKRSIKLTESDLKRVISESVKRVLKESRDESFYYDLRDEMISTRDFVFEKYSKLSKNGVITLGQLDGALQSLGGTLLNTACNLHDKFPANYGYGSPDYECIGY